MTFIPNSETKPNTVVLRKSDSVYMYIECENDIAFGIRDHFTFEVPNARFHPLVKARKWDGKIRLFNPYAKKLYAGLWKTVVNYCRNRGLEVLVDPEIYEADKEITPESIIEYIKTLNLSSKGKPIKPTLPKSPCRTMVLHLGSASVPVSPIRY